MTYCLLLTLDFFQPSSSSTWARSFTASLTHPISGSSHISPAHISQALPVTFGIPQGSILGPLLFLFPSAKSSIKNATAFMMPSSTPLPNPPPATLSNCLNELQVWLLPSTFNFWISITNSSISACITTFKTTLKTHPCILVPSYREPATYSYSSLYLLFIIWVYFYICFFVYYCHFFNSISLFLFFKQPRAYKRCFK